MKEHNVALPTMTPFGLFGSSVKVIDVGDRLSIRDVIYPISDANLRLKFSSLVDPTENGVLYTSNGLTVSDAGYVTSVGKDELSYSMFIATVETRHSTFGHANVAELTKRFEPQVRAYAQNIAERNFWQGLTGKNDDDKGTRSLVTSPIEISGTYSPKVGSAILDSEAAKLGYIPTLHMPRSVADLSGAKSQDETSNKPLLTKINSPVVAGSGYIWDTPTTGKIYATGPITTLIGDIVHDTENVVDRSRNDVTLTWNVPVAVVWTTANAFSINIDLTA